MSHGALAALHVEAFSEGPGAGNGAAVVRLEAPVDDAWMQAVAGSLRQSETAFLLQEGESWRLRWFTPTQEVPLCGHATLAALLAHVETLTDAQDRDDVMTAGGADLGRGNIIPLRVGLSPLAMSHEHVGTAELRQHRAGNLAGEGSRVVDRQILSTVGDAIAVTIDQGLHRTKVREGREHGHINGVVVGILEREGELLHESDCL